MNKRQVLKVIKGSMSKAQIVRMLQDSTVRIVEIPFAKLYITSEEQCRSCRVELVCEGYSVGSDQNKVYFYSTRQLRVHQFFDSDSEEHSV